jgi:benzodiazapine receptor
MKWISTRWLNIFMLVATLFVNWLATSLPLFGRDTGEISDLFPTAITPAGYAFSIWGIIYTLLIGFIIVQASPSANRYPEIDRIGYWFMISSVLNIAWLVLWHALWITSTVIVMIALLISLMIIYRRTRPWDEKTPFAIRLWVSGAFSVYLGWISVATIVNISVMLFNLGWDGWGIPPEIWAMGLLVIAGLLALTIGLMYRDFAYGLVIAWASLAVAVKQKEMYPALAIVAYVVAIIVFIYGFIIWIKPYLRKSKST